MGIQSYQYPITGMLPGIGYSLFHRDRYRYSYVPGFLYISITIRIQGIGIRISAHTRCQSNSNGNRIRLSNIGGTGTKCGPQISVPEQKVSIENWYQNKNWFGATISRNKNYLLQLISDYRVVSPSVSLPESFYVKFFVIGSRIFKYQRGLSCPPWLVRIIVYLAFQNNLLLLF